MNEVLEFIHENYYVLIPILNVLGLVAKKSMIVKDKYIPVVLICLGVLFGALTALQADLYVFDGIKQGLLCAGAAIGLYQVPKQIKKNE